jgi:hypothetical protein
MSPRLAKSSEKRLTILDGVTLLRYSLNTLNNKSFPHQSAQSFALNFAFKKVQSDNRVQGTLNRG